MKKTTNIGDVPASKLKPLLYEKAIPLYRTCTGNNSINNMGIEPIMQANKGADNNKPNMINKVSRVDINSNIGYARIKIAIDATFKTFAGLNKSIKRPETKQQKLYVQIEMEFSQSALLGLILK